LNHGRSQRSKGILAYELTDSYQIGKHAAADTYTPEFKQRIGVGIDHDPGDLMATIDIDLPQDVQMIAALCRGYLLQNGLAQGDRLSMANSVELRLPLIDYRLVELLVGLQKHAPMYADGPKKVLRDAARGLVPDSVFLRPKRPFSPPTVSWLGNLRTTYGGDLVTGALVDERILGPVAAHSLTTPQSRFGTGNELFLKYLVLEHWYRGMKNIAAPNAN
jgi:asparagine synthase (glutamine-hydrolysing)